MMRDFRLQRWTAHHSGEGIWQAPPVCPQPPSTEAHSRLTDTAIRAEGFAEDRTNTETALPISRSPKTDHGRSANDQEFQRVITATLAVEIAPSLVAAPALRRVRRSERRMATRKPADRGFDRGSRPIGTKRLAIAIVVIGGGGICQSDFSRFQTRAITALLFSAGRGRCFDLNDQAGSCCSKVNLDKGPAFRGPGSREPRRKSVAAMRQRSFAQEQIMPPAGAETKGRTFMQALAEQRSGLIIPCRDTDGCKRYFRAFGEISRCFRVATRRRHFFSCGYDYIFFFEVFFATFLVADFAVFLAFFAFLAMSSSAKKMTQ
jgi:hypothetical protein